MSASPTTSTRPIPVISVPFTKKHVLLVTLSGGVASSDDRLSKKERVRRLCLVYCWGNSKRYDPWEVTASASVTRVNTGTRKGTEWKIDKTVAYMVPVTRLGVSLGVSSCTSC